MGYANLYAQDIKKRPLSAKKQVDTSSLDINKNKASISILKKQILFPKDTIRPKSFS
jgi:hypothetical protein